MTCLNHTCNVLVAVSAPRLEEKAEEANCTGDFYISAKTFPGVISLSIGVLAEDPEWSDSVKWVCQALIAAERHGITKEHIDLHHGRQQDEKQGEQLTQVTTFGEDYKDMFCCAIEAVGNTGDMWASVNPAVLNFPVADNSSGVLCSSSLGPVEEAGPDPSLMEFCRTQASAVTSAVGSGCIRTMDLLDTCPKTMRQPHLAKAWMLIVAEHWLLHCSVGATLLSLWS